MTNETLIALKASIAAWERKITETGPERINTGRSSCPLCILHLDATIPHCTNCPIFQKTGRRYCAETPYVEASWALEGWREELRNFTLYPATDFPRRTSAVEVAAKREQFHAAAEEEIAFLKSLLPAKNPTLTP